MSNVEEYWKILDGAQQFLRGKDRVVSEISAEDVVLEALQKELTISEMDMEQLSEAIKSCTKCALHAGRKNPVPGKGVLNPKVMIIGEAPGAQEDEQGLPFVGKSGEYLDRWMSAIHLTREDDLFIGNIMKCRPPGNRDPFPEEQRICIPYLVRQLELIKPQSILCLGRVSSQILLKTEEGIGKLRGKIYSYENIPLVVTYHPSAVLRYPEKYRRPVWEDLKLLKSIFDPEA